MSFGLPDKLTGFEIPYADLSVEDIRHLGGDHPAPWVPAVHQVLVELSKKIRIGFGHVGLIPGRALQASGGDSKVWGVIVSDARGV